MKLEGEARTPASTCAKHSQLASSQHGTSTGLAFYASAYNAAGVVICLQAFDELLLLKRGGRTIFHGPLGRNSQYLIDYFTSTPGVEPPQGKLNPATWMLDISAVGAEASLGVDFADIYADSELCM